MIPANIVKRSPDNRVQMFSIGKGHYLIIFANGCKTFDSLAKANWFFYGEMTKQAIEEYVRNGFSPAMAYSMAMGKIAYEQSINR